MGGIKGCVLVMLALLCAASGAVGAPSPTRVHFTAVGDFGQSAASTGSMLSAVATADPDLLLALGDLSYGVTGQETTWCDFVTQRVGAGFPFELVAGNHESNGINGNINDFASCLPNQLPGAVGTYGRQYYVDVPQDDPLVRFVMISPSLTFPDGRWDYTVGSPRYTWTANAIDGARAEDIPWVVVGQHKTCLSAGGYTCDPGPDLTNMLLAKKVDLALMGHEHDYERTKQLAHGSGCPTLAIGSYDADCVADSDNQLTAGRGTVFMTIGTGGISQRDVNTADPEYPYFAALSGGNANETYGASDFVVTPEDITVSFLRAPAPGNGTFTDAFTITKDPNVGNAPPTASFTSTVDNLTATFSSSGSSDTDGSVASYAWDFGDGGTSTQPNPQHTYTAANTYNVRLTVTDDDGATGTVTVPTTVTAPPAPGVLASDTFTRTVNGGWGSANVGGAWTTIGPAARFSVAGGTGRLSLASSQTLSAELQGISSTRTVTTATFATDKVVEGLYVGLVGRQVGADQYVARLRTQADGQARLYLLQNFNNVQASALVPGLVITPGTTYKMAMEVVGTNPTRVSAKVWRASQPEPTGWQRTGTNTFAGLQAPGRVGLFDYLPGTASGVAPVTVSWDDLTVTEPAP